MSVFEQLQAEINSVVGDANQPQLKFYACQECGLSYQCSAQPTECNFCKKEGAMQWPGDTKQQAEERAKRAKGVSAPQPAVAEPEPVAAPEPVAEKPKRTVRKKAEPKAEPVAAAPEPVEESEDATPEASDYRAKRQGAIQNFIEQKGLNEVSPVSVGTAVVQTVGFTLWVDKQPIFRMMQPFESPADFQRAYDESRAEQPALQIDCCQCSQASNAELMDVIFKGDLIASTNNGNGTQWVRRGDRVTLGAYKTKNNHIRFVVLGVK